MIYHMCPAEAWEEAVASGEYIGTADDRRDGFLHFSTAEQIAESARRHRAGEAGLVLVAVEAARLGDRLRWEKSRGGARTSTARYHRPRRRASTSCRSARTASICSRRWARSCPIGASFDATSRSGR